MCEADYPVEQDKLCCHISVCHQIRPEDHVICVLRRLDHILTCLQKSDKIRVIKVTGPVLPVDCLPQITAHALLQKVFPCQIVHDHAVRGRCAGKSKISIETPSIGIAEGLPQSQPCLDREIGRKQIQTAAVVFDRSCKDQVVHIQVWNGGKICLQVTQHSLSDIGERRKRIASKGEHIRSIAAGDLRIQQCDRLLLIQSALSQINQLNIAVGTSRVEGCDFTRK